MATLRSLVTELLGLAWLWRCRVLRTRGPGCGGAALGHAHGERPLGGAIATHVRVQHPLFSHTLFPLYVAALIWGGLFLRDVRLRAFLPWKSAH